MKKYTYNAKNEDNKGRWFVVDAEGKVLGRLATVVASRLRGKCNPLFTPHADVGDYIVVINADKVVMTGKKWEQKMYYRHTGYPGGLKETAAKDMLLKKPEEIVRHAVKGMLPKNRLGRKLFKKLKVYAGAEHPHAAQQAEALNV